MCICKKKYCDCAKSNPIYRRYLILDIASQSSSPTKLCRQHETTSGIVYPEKIQSKNLGGLKTDTNYPKQIKLKTHARKGKE